MNYRTVSLNVDDMKNTIKTIENGFVFHGVRVRPNHRIATILQIQANLGLRISDVLSLMLKDIIADGERLRLNITEQKTGKRREFTVPVEIYQALRLYMLEQGKTADAKLFELSGRSVQKHLQMATTYLGLENISTHSFRKFFATEIYNRNGYNIELVRVLLQHSSVNTTQRYIGISRKDVETALQNHLYLM